MQAQAVMSGRRGELLTSAPSFAADHQKTQDNCYRSQPTPSLLGKPQAILLLPDFSGGGRMSIYT